MSKKVKLGKKIINVMYAKNGNLARTNRISLSAKWVDGIGVEEQDNSVNLYIMDNKIIITKEDLSEEYDKILYSQYSLWRTQMEGFKNEFEKGNMLNPPGSIKSSKKTARENFKEWAELDKVLAEEEMFDLEKKYNKEYNKIAW